MDPRKNDVTASSISRYRLDDLRRLATSLTASLGVAPPRASAMATHLLWFDAAGASSHGISTLPGWLERIERKEIDPSATGRASLEHAGTAIFDAQFGLPPLTLETAAGIASEKARDVGIGVVRVRHIGPMGSPAPIAAGLAIGPFATLIVGPSPSISLALPTVEGLPAIYDTDLAKELGENASPSEEWLHGFAPWVASLAGQDDWIVLAISINALESLASFHERSSKLLESNPLGPRILANRRQEARERGVFVSPDTLAALKNWAGRANLPWPTVFGS